MDTPTPQGAGSAGPASDLPVRHVTMNQVVAYNIAYFRNAEGLTQEELGKRLEKITGRRWSKATISAAERSWDGSRIRTFDADDLVALSQALEVPVTALLLPPDEDGTVTDFVFANVGSAPYRERSVKGGGTGSELMAQLFASEYNYTYGSDPFFERLQEALEFYFGAIPEDFFISRPVEPIDDDVLVFEQVHKLKRQIATLREVMATLDRAAKKLDAPAQVTSQGATPGVDRSFTEEEAEQQPKPGPSEG
ncbi:helix-turn-helix transcriptional regulator [Streptomyces longwoodensis]|uniref:helix-turn-helix domain-containing protein n=1 Tax=Streptomyces longwoodensis TaxID=68231 RepID=UPI0033EC83D3